MKRTNWIASIYIVGAMLFLSSGIALSGDLIEKLLDSEHMGSGECEKYDPKYLCDTISRSGKFGSFALADVDECYQAYSQCMHETVNRAYPKAKKIRNELIISYGYLNEFMVKLFMPGSWHADKRVTGEIEWQMWSGTQKDFNSNNTGNDITDIESLANIIIKARHEILGPESLSTKQDELYSILDSAIEHLINAEKHMTEKEIKHYRKEYLKYLAKVM